MTMSAGITSGRTTRVGMPKVVVSGLSVRFVRNEAVRNVSLSFSDRMVTALIGPSGCGKSTLLRAINRMNETISGAETSGRVEIDGQDIYDKAVDPVSVRARVGMVFQKPNPFPKSIYDNVAYGLRIHGLASGTQEYDEKVRDALVRSGIWDEVRDRLDHPGNSLSGGQQQRLCIARAIAVNPEIILMDEPTSALDPIATARIEELIDELRRQYCIIVVTHSMAQAARVSQNTAFLYQGEVVEAGPTEEIFTNPRDRRTQDYITGRFG